MPETLQDGQQTAPGSTPDIPTMSMFNASLVPLPDGRGAIATFNIMNGFIVSIPFPEQVIDNFFAQWIAIKQEMQSIARLVNKVNRSKT